MSTTFKLSNKGKKLTLIYFSLLMLLLTLIYSYSFDLLPSQTGPKNLSQGTLNQPEFSNKALEYDNTKHSKATLKGKTRNKY